MKTEGGFKILIINDSAVSDAIGRSLNTEFGERIEVSKLEGVRVENWCNPTDREIRRIVGFANKTDADLIVVGNNVGAGIHIVKRLPRGMRDKIVIFFAVSAISGHFTRKYREYGITRFYGEIKHLMNEVRNLLSN